jgi:uncharacterized membrane protein (UPF0127 family)
MPGAIFRGLFISVIVLFASVLHTGALSNAATDETLIPIMTPAGTTIQAELADTAEKRGRGLMFRESLAKDHGMLFIFTEPQQWSFWMKNTRISLDIIWLDEKKRIVHMERHVPTCGRTDDGCPQYQPNDRAMYVLELVAGMVDSLKLQRGNVLKFHVNG